MKKISQNKLKQLSFVILGLYNSTKFKILKQTLSEYYPADIVAAIKNFKSQNILNILRVTDYHKQVEIFQYFSVETQLEIFPLLRETEVRFYLDYLPIDDRNALLREMDENLKQNVLDMLSERERTIAKTLLSFDEDMAGSMVSKAPISKDYWKIGQVIENLRADVKQIEDISVVYVLDDQGYLVGFMSLKTIIFSNAQDLVADVMKPDPLFIMAYQPKEDAVEMIQKYDIVSLPVLNTENKMIGIITYDDIMDFIIEQDTEDIHRFAGVSTIEGKSSEEGYLEQPILLQVKRRFTWTIIPIFMEVLTGLVIGRAEELLASVFILATFIPMIAASGGNIGSQSASLITRAIALKEISFRHLFSVLKRELLVSVFIAIACCSILVVKMLVFPRLTSSSVDFSLIILTVSLALGAQLIVSALLGALVPMLAVKFKIDPAIMSAPVLASLVDIIGLLMFFGLAKAIIFT